MNKTLIGLGNIEKTTKTDKITHTSANKQKETKNGSSLFDSLLNDAKQHSEKENKKPTKSKSKINSKEKANKILKNDINTKANTLDKLSLNAKINKDNKNNDNNKTKTNNKKEISNINDTLKDKSANKTSTKIDIPTNDKKTTTKENIQDKIDTQKKSLFDSLINEVSNTDDAKTNTKINTKTTNNKHSKQVIVHNNNNIDLKQNTDRNTLNIKENSEEKDDLSTQDKKKKKSLHEPEQAKNSLFDNISNQLQSEQISTAQKNSKNSISKKDNTKEKNKNNAFDSWNKPNKTIETNIKTDDNHILKDYKSHKQDTDKDSTHKKDTKTKSKKSLMDSLMDDIKDTNVSNTKTTIETKNKLDTTHNEIKSKILHTKTKQEKVLLQSHISSGAKKIIYDQKDTLGVKKASNILELNLKNISIDKNTSVKDNINSIDNIENKLKQKSTLSLEEVKLANKYKIKKPMRDTDKIAKLAQDNKSAEPIKSADKNSDLLGKLKIKDEIEIIVPANIMSDFKNKITKARAKATTMMSEVAKKMVENYKPPQTAFRITLNPHNLGSIEIVIKKTQKDNLGSNPKSSGLNISMNIDNSSTHELIKTYQNDLRHALVRNLANDSFNLNITNNPQSQSSQNMPSGNQHNRRDQDSKNKNKKEETIHTNDVEDIENTPNSKQLYL